MPQRGCGALLSTKPMEKPQLLKIDQFFFFYFQNSCQGDLAICHNGESLHRDPINGESLFAGFQPSQFPSLDPQHRVFVGASAAMELLVVKCAAIYSGRHHIEAYLVALERGLLKPRMVEASNGTVSDVVLPNYSKYLCFVSLSLTLVDQILSTWQSLCRGCCRANLANGCDWNYSPGSQLIRHFQGFVCNGTS